MTFEDLTKLSYTDCVYKEVLRLWPPIPEMGRLVTKKFDINDHEIPENTWLLVSTYVSARCEEFFERAFEFEPERFRYEEAAKINNYTYFPFSLGARNCIGQNFARVNF